MKINKEDVEKLLYSLHKEFTEQMLERTGADKVDEIPLRQILQATKKFTKEELEILVVVQILTYEATFVGPDGTNVCPIKKDKYLDLIWFFDRGSELSREFAEEIGRLTNGMN